MSVFVVTSLSYPPTAAFSSCALHGSSSIGFVLTMTTQTGVFIGVFMTDIKHFFKFSLEKPYKYVHDILCMLNIYGDLHSLMFMHVTIYKTHLFSKYLRLFCMPRTVGIKQEEDKPTPTRRIITRGSQT